MKRRRKFELLLADLWRLIGDPERAERDYALSSAVWNLMDFTEEMMRDPSKTRQLLEFGCALRSSNAVGRQVAEQRLMEHLDYLARQCCDYLQDRKLARLPGLYAVIGAPAKFQPALQVVRVLHDFALGCFEFKRPRDSFGGRRRAMAFEVLGCLSRVVDLPGVVRLAQRSLRKEESIEGRGAGQFLDQYLEERDLSWEDAMTEDLPPLNEPTGSRSTPSQTPNAPARTDAMGEF